MSFQLNSQNIFDYLNKYNFCFLENKNQNNIELKTAKNFNLLVTLASDRKILVKQERYTSEAKKIDEFINEWQINQLLKHFLELHKLRGWFSELLHFNPSDRIIIFNYLSDYQDLADFYNKENLFPPQIATTIGTILATIHQATLERQDYREFLQQNIKESSIDLHTKLDRITPEIFSSIPADSIKFFALYQRYDSLGQAISHLTNTFDSCCLIHNDLKLNNILLYLDWENLVSSNSSNPSTIRLIDWERCSWGDPAYDLGTLIANYLQLWLSSLVVSKTIAIEESLSMAMTPLELLQPSLSALLTAYLGQFPEILTRHQDFLCRVVQFAGLALIAQIQAMIQYQKTFGNTGICMLQVAKSLLCRPESTIKTIFGKSASQLAESNFTAV
jgi:thiamine kinase-like enzyme